MKILVFILIILISLLVFTAFLFFWYWKFKKQVYTRERFAFVAVGLGASFLLTILPLIFGGSLWTNFAISALNEYLGLNWKPTSISGSEKGILLIFFGLYCYFVSSLFRNWSGSISERQNLLEKEREDSTLIKDFISVVKQKENLQIFNPENQTLDFSIEFPKQDDVAWSIKSANYLMLLNNQIKINIEQDWHQEQSCFISRFSANSNAIAILSLLQDPSENRVIKFLNYTESIVSTPLFRYYVLVKKGNDKTRKVTIHGKTVDILYEDSILESLIDFSDYKESICQVFEKNEILPGYKYTIADIYTSPSCKKLKRLINGEKIEEHISDIEDYVSVWLNDSTQKKHIALLAEYGQGKSVLAQRICYQIFKGNIKTERIPIIIELRGKYPKQYSDIIKLFADWASNYNINPNALYRLHLAGKLVLIFEGFDEMELVGDYSIRLDHFRKIWEFSFPNSKIMITGRPNYFLNETELKTILKTTETQTNLPHCEEIYIEMFDRNRIEEALRNSDKEVRDDILELLSKTNINKSFVDLISRPALLFLTSIVWKERNLGLLKNNINSASVIEEFVKQTYERQEGKGVKTPLSSAERSYFMLGVAIGMVQQSLYTNQISLRNVKKLTEKLYANFPDEITTSDTSQRPISRKPLKERFDERYNEDAVFQDIVSCGILVRDLSTFDSFKFAHKSFLEYLVSFYYANTLIDFKENHIDKVIIRTIRKCLDANLDDIRKSPEVFRFIIQLITKRINLSESTGDKSKMTKIFGIVYPYKWANMRLVMKGIPLFGRNLKSAVNLFLLFLFTLAGLFIIAYIVAGFSYTTFAREVGSKAFAIAVFAMFFMFYYLPIYLQNKLHKKLSIKKYSNLKFFDTLLSKLFPENIEQVVDSGNLNLWYQTCLEVGVSKQTLKKELPKNLFHELDNYHQSII